MASALRRTLFLSLVCSLSCASCRETSTRSEAKIQQIEAQIVTSTPLLGVWGNATPELNELPEERIWFVGGRASETPGQVHPVIAVYEPQSAPEQGQIRLHFQGDGQGLLWWVWGSGERGQVWAVGDSGQILSLETDGEVETWRATRLEIDDIDQEKLVLWGIWGAKSPSGELSLFAVGGSVLRGGPRGVLLQRDTQGVWRRISQPLLPSEDPADPLVGTNLYKVWGDGSQIWIVGEGSLVLTAQLAWEGSEAELKNWRDISPQTDLPELLFTVAGSSSAPQEKSEIWVVGGYAQGKIWSAQMNNDLTDSWTSYDQLQLPPLNGIAVSQQRIWSVGQRGFICSWDTTSPPSPESIRKSILQGGDLTTLHSVWIDQNNDPWVVGGDLSSLQSGVILTPREWDGTRPKVQFMSW